MVAASRGGWETPCPVADAPQVGARWVLCAMQGGAVQRCEQCKRHVVYPRLDLQYKPEIDNMVRGTSRDPWSKTCWVRAEGWGVRGLPAASPRLVKSNPSPRLDTVSLWN